MINNIFPIGIGTFRIDLNNKENITLNCWTFRAKEVKVVH